MGVGVGIRVAGSARRLKSRLHEAKSAFADWVCRLGRLAAEGRLRSV